MNNMITLLIPEYVNFRELLRSSKTLLEIDCKGELVKLLSEELTENEQKWYIANLYMSNHYNQNTDYPIKVKDIYSILGYANKANANRTIKGNFIENTDYKIILKQNFKNEIKEDIILNIETFKELCMLVKSDKGKEIRQYYMKLSNVYNKMVKKEIESD